MILININWINKIKYLIRPTIKITIHFFARRIVKRIHKVNFIEIIFNKLSFKYKVEFTEVWLVFFYRLHVYHVISKLLFFLKLSILFLLMIIQKNMRQTVRGVCKKQTKRYLKVVSLRHPRKGRAYESCTLG